MISKGGIDMMKTTQVMIGVWSGVWLGWNGTLNG